MPQQSHTFKFEVKKRKRRDRDRTSLFAYYDLAQCNTYNTEITDDGEEEEDNPTKTPF